MLKQIVAYFLPVTNYTPEFYKGVPKWMHPLYLKKVYKYIVGEELDLKNPKRLTEKIQWIKLYDNLPIKSDYCDKLTCRDLVRSKIPEINFAHIYGAWDSFKEIDFSVCPKSFFLKTNHASKAMIRIRDKDRFISLPQELEKAASIMDRWLSISYDTVSAFEQQYKGIKPKIYAEECLGGAELQRLSDYKIFCFNGEPKFIEYFIELKPKRIQMAVFDADWNIQEFYHSADKYDGLPISRPGNFDKMLEYAKILSSDFKFVRVDLFDVDNKIYFGEMTFTPSSGFMNYVPKKYDEILGSLLKLK